MNASRSRSENPERPDLDEERRRVLLDRQLERLERLIEVGMEMVEALRDQAKGEGPPVVEGDVVLAYGRVLRAVRLAILLQSRLAEAPPSESREPEVQVLSWLDVHTARTEMRKENVEDIVEYVAGRQHRDGETARGVAHEAAERLERDEIYRDLLDRPLSEIVADICRDLGLEPDWDDLAQQPWARRERASDEVGRPLAARAARSAWWSAEARGGDGAAPPARAFEPPD
jgi:hypothetical protein